ncbi:MAG: glycosyltransferase family 4 protein [Desulfovibrio sp.]|nr:glycosyltransferase family 4 protein [Desulfovibrio sp.]
MKHPKIFGTFHEFLEPNVILGRTVANEGFIQTLFAMDPFDEYHFFLYDPKNMQKNLPTLDWPAVKRQAVHIHPCQHVIQSLGSKDFFCFHFADPLTEQIYLAKIRNTFSKRLFPITSTPHTLSYHHFAQDFLQEIWPGASPRDVILATSQAAIDVIQGYFSQLRANYRIPDTWHQPDLRLLPLGVNIHKFRPASSQEKIQAREHLGIEQQEVVCLAHGRITVDDKMDLLPLILALHRLQQRENPPRIHLLLSGRIRENDTYPKVLEAQTKAFGIPCTIFDSPSDSELETIYRASDIFLSPSDNIQETFGLTILEAQAMGLPVIASDWDGYRDILRHGECGFLIPTLAPLHTPRLNTIRPILPENIFQLFLAEQTPIDVDALAKAIETLATSPTLRQSMGQKGRAFVCQGYSWEQIIERWLGILDQLWEIPISAEEEARIRAAEHPCFLDYTKIFSHHPTHVLIDPPFHGMTLALTQHGKNVLRNREVAVYWPPLTLFLDSVDMRKILTFARNGIDGTLLYTRIQEDMDAETAQFALLFALKHDLLAILPPESLPSQKK